MIRQISISNFKCFRNVIGRLGSINLLTGVNGRGKSSFIQSLLLLSQNWKEKEIKNLLPNGSWVKLGLFDDIVNSYAEDKFITFEFKSDGNQENDFYLKFTQDPEKTTIGRLSVFTVDGKNVIANTAENEGYVDGDNSEDGELETMGSVDDYSELSQLKRIIFISADRCAAQETETLDETTRFLKADGSNVLNVIWSKGEEFKAKVRDRISQIFDGAGIDIQLINNQLVLTLNSSLDGKLYRPENVGYGFSYLLSVVTASLLAEERDILIIENPEAHLHPSAQSRIMRILMKDSINNRFQLIVETHSDHVVNSVLVGVKGEEIPCSEKDVEILFFSNTINQNEQIDTKVENLEITKKGRILSPPSQFCDQYGKDLKFIYS